LRGGKHGAESGKFRCDLQQLTTAPCCLLCPRSRWEPVVVLLFQDGF
jgi:hypothetical protein